MMVRRANVGYLCLTRNHNSETDRVLPIKFSSIRAYGKYILPTYNKKDVLCGAINERN